MAGLYSKRLKIGKIADFAKKPNLPKRPKIAVSAGGTASQMIPKTTHVVGPPSGGAIPP